MDSLDSFSRTSHCMHYFCPFLDHVCEFFMALDHGQNNLSLLSIPNNNYVLDNYYYDDPFSSVEKWLDQPQKN